MARPRSPREIASQVISTEAAAVSNLLGQLDESFDRAVAAILESTGRVVCTGMGKSGLIMKKVAATLSSTGTPALFLHPAEAIHGDLGMIAEGDLVLAASYSGTTEELVRLAEVLKRLGVPLVLLTGSRESVLAKLADLHLPVEIDQEACPHNLAPTASTTAMLALGDALALAISEQKGFSSEDFARLHPGGQLGRKLLRVQEVMHRGEDVPQVERETTMRETIYEMSRKRLGITAVTSGDDQLVGCISDGDLRRLLETDPELLHRSAGDCMKSNPRTITQDQLASAALHTMEEHRITALFVCRGERQLVGVVHLHDLWGLELF